MKRTRPERAPPPPGAHGLHLVFLPDRLAPRFFLWGARPDAPALALHGHPEKAALIGEELVPDLIEGVAVPLLEALPGLAALTAEELQHAPASVAAWSLGAKLALDLVSRGRIAPRLLRVGHRTEARFGAALALPGDAERVTALAKAFPPAAYAVPIAPFLDGQGRQGRGGQGIGALEVWTPEALLRAFLDAAADALVRAARPARGRTPRSDHVPWELRLARALAGADPTFAPVGFPERTLLAGLDAWIRPALGAEPGAPRACFRLDLPEEETGAPPSLFPLRFLLQAVNDPSLLLPAGSIWAAGRGRPDVFHRPEEHLLRALAVAARLFPPVGRSLREARPEQVLLDPAEAWAFLEEGAAAFSEAGLGVILPAELTRSGQRRLRLRMRVGSRPAAGAHEGGGELRLGALVDFRWEVAAGGETLSAADLEALARLKEPLVRFRGQWVAVAPGELSGLQRALEAGGGRLTSREALAAALEGRARPEGLPGPAGLEVEVVPEGRFAEVVDRLREAPARSELPAPRDLRGTLRPYQSRGLGWLAQMDDLGLGACLADDMGLGKTIQLIAFLLQRREARPAERRPALLVCPTSVIGNWERELSRFAPSLPVVRHYGPERARSAKGLERLPPGAILLTSYALLRLDEGLLSAVDWSVAALDEAQNIKNAASRTARAARGLRAECRIALTGTPVENRLAEWWSISAFLNPGLLGPLEAFRSRYAVPIERFGDDEAAERLRRMVRPFILRRLKSDPAILPDLPSKQERRILCTLTREQATLYRAAVNDALRRIQEAEGIQRRGLVLALITALKQICNHPAQYLNDPGPLAGRSGKLDRLCEMLEEALASGDRALVFTQYREMGDRLVAELSRRLGEDVPFLHGGTARSARDELVRRFQEGPDGPRVFVLSIKAGGTGLNLTAANHVFHFDRWWNPAVEDQATDRAHRMGQRRAVQVHKLLCAGTVEEKVDAVLEKKRGLAERIVGAGEQWITELDDEALRDLFALEPDAVVEDEGDREEEGGAAPDRRGGGRRRRREARP